MAVANRKGSNVVETLEPDQYEFGGGGVRSVPRFCWLHFIQADRQEARASSQEL